RPAARDRSPRRNDLRGPPVAAEAWADPQADGEAPEGARARRGRGPRARRRLRPRLTRSSPPPGQKILLFQPVPGFPCPTERPSRGNDEVPDEAYYEVSDTFDRTLRPPVTRCLTPTTGRLRPPITRCLTPTTGRLRPPITRC